MWVSLKPRRHLVPALPPEAAEQTDAATVPATSAAPAAPDPAAGRDATASTGPHSVIGDEPAD